MLALSIHELDETIFTTAIPERIIDESKDESSINELREVQEERDLPIRDIETDILEKPEQYIQRFLVARALSGDAKAFGDIVDRYSPLMLRTATMIVGDRDIAEDVVQDSLIQAWQHLADLREASALRPWLMRIVVNQCISFKRRLARTATFMRNMLSEQETHLIAQAADEYKGLLERDWDLAHAIEHLPSKQRDVIMLHYYHSMTLPEMARALSTSENTLKKRIQAALTNLRRLLRVSDRDEDMSAGQLLMTPG
jgi:RNA polymerase sigma-70 factor (ECF subfamily)